MLATAAAIRCTVTAWQAARMRVAERPEPVAEPLETSEAATASMAVALAADDEGGEPN